MASLDKVLMMYTDHKNNARGEDFGGVGYYRVVQPARALGIDYTGNWIHKVTGHDFFEEKDKVEYLKKLWDRYDVVYTKCLNDAEMTSDLLASAKFLGKKLVTDIDDDFLHIDEGTFLDWAVKNGKMNPNLNRAIFSEADAVSVQSEILKEGTRNYNNNITVIPNAIDLSLYHPKPKNNKKIRILWAGSISHEMDLRMIEEPLREVLEKYKDKVEYYTFGYDTDFFYKMRYVFVLGTKQFSGYVDKLCEINPDIALAPLQNTKFGSGKSIIKWYEMSAVGAPVVASHVYPYKGSAMKHGENCLFARNSADWVKYMSRLIEDKDYREELNKNAIEEIRKNHTIDTMKEKWRDFFLKL